jgi:hypothetical protein
VIAQLLALSADDPESSMRQLRRIVADLVDL